MSIHPNTGIGHVHLTVSDLDRALAFYRDVLGFEVTSRYGRDAVFLSAGGYHHPLRLQTWAGRGRRPPPPSSLHEQVSPPPPPPPRGWGRLGRRAKQARGGSRARGPTPP